MQVQRAVKVGNRGDAIGELLDGVVERDGVCGCGGMGGTGAQDKKKRESKGWPAGFEGMHGVSGLMIARRRVQAWEVPRID